VFVKKSVEAAWEGEREGGKKKLTLSLPPGKGPF